MHVVVVGAGAIGTLYGGWLLGGGGDVSFVARGRRLDQLRGRGVQLGNGGDYPAVAAARANELRPADVLLLTVKLYDLDEAARAAAPALADGGLVVGLQNGVDAAEVLAHVFPSRQVMVGPVYSAARLDEGGAVHAAGARNDVVIGAIGGPAHPLAGELVRLWSKAGVDAAIAHDIAITLWTKFLVFATNAALTCLTRQPAGVIYHDPDLLALAARSIDEIAATAAAEGVHLPATAQREALALLRALPSDMVASMRQDLDAGRRLELDGVCGAIVRRARARGIATPFHETAYASLKPWRHGAAPAALKEVA